MLYNKNNLLCWQIASEDNTNRPELAGVLFKKDRTVATDSYKLLEVKNPDDWDKQIAEFPQLPDKSKPLTAFAKKGYLIPAKSVKKVLSNLGDIKNDSLPILKNAIFTNSPDELCSKIATTNLDKVDIVLTKNLKGAYPNYEQIMPNIKNYKKTNFNIKYLKEIIDTLIKMDLPANQKIEVLIADDGNKPLIIKTKTEQHQEITALIMPLKN